MTKQYSEVHLEIGIRPDCLLLAIRSKNIGMITMLFEFLSLQARESRFVADECFAASIKYDCIEAAQKILELRWHSPNDEDYSLAERCDNSVYVWLEKRRRPAPVRRDDSGALDWDTWEDDGGDGAADEDDDWDDDDDDGFGDAPADADAAAAAADGADADAVVAADE